MTALMIALSLAPESRAQETTPDIQRRETEPVRIICIGAHPDDCDVKMGGTAALWAEAGHAVKFLSVTNGDAGHHEMGGEALAKRRRAEAEEAGRRLGIAEYEVLDNHDGELMNTLAVRRALQRRIRAWKADVVIAPRPYDYHPDHRYTGEMVQDAAYLTIVPNVTPDTPPLEKNPVFLYLSDGFEKPLPFQPDIAVGIDAVLDTKINALDAHTSQFYEWLPWTGGALDEVPEGAEARKAWLRQNWTADALAPGVRAALEKWHGAEAAQQIEHAEAFEIGEYGHQPTDDEIRRLFPMLGN